MNEKQAAVLLAQMEGFSSSVKTLTEKFTAMQTDCKELKELDVKAVIEEVEKLKASNERIVESIARSRKGFYVPGLEDEAKKFSVLRAVAAIHLENWSGAGYEKEVLEAARQAMVKSSHVVGDDELGGYFIPDQIIPDVIGAIYTQSQFISLNGDDGTTRVTVLDNLVGGNVKIPKFDGGLIAYWIGEEDEYVESQTNVGDLTMTPKKLGVLIRLTQEMRGLAGFGFEKLLRTDMVRAISKKLDHAIPFGRGGDNMPLGIANTNGIRIYSAESGKSGVLGTDSLVGAQFQADWSGAELDYLGLDKMKLSLEEDDIAPEASTHWFSSPRYFSRLRNIRLAHGNAAPDASDVKPLILGSPMISDARLAEAIGKFAKHNQFGTTNDPGETIGANTTNTDDVSGDVMYGNLSEVILGRWGGIQIEDDKGKGKGFTTDHIYIKMRMWVDVGIRQPRAIVWCPDATVRG